MRIAAFAVLLCACFDPGPAPLRCSEAQPGCPDGFVCLGGMCKDSASNADLLSINDQSMDMMITDFSSIPGCADGKGSTIGKGGCWTCPGLFGAGKKASSLCHSAFGIPTNSNLITDSECLAVGTGFFYSSAYGSTSFNYADPNTAQCTNMPTSGIAAFFGCGAGGGVVSPSVACRGFRANLQCIGASGLTCPNFDLDQATNTKPTNGVLCCPK